MIFFLIKIKIYIILDMYKYLSNFKYNFLMWNCRFGRRKCVAALVYAFVKIYKIYFFYGVFLIDLWILFLFLFLNCWSFSEFSVAVGVYNTKGSYSPSPRCMLTLSFDKMATKLPFADIQKKKKKVVFSRQR